MSELYKLKELTSKIGSGSTPRGGDKAYKSTGVAFIRSQNVQDLSFSCDGLARIDNIQAAALNGVSVLEHDILINITGDSIARTCRVPKSILPARVSQHVAIIRSKEPEYAEYLSYYLQYLKPYLLKICRVGGTRNALTKEALEKIEIIVQDQPKKIARALSTIDAKIELNNRINAELESMAKALYEYWFVQFDFPNAKGKPYKSSGGKMAWNEELKREIPEGWRYSSFADWIYADKSGDWGEEIPTGNHTLPVDCVRGTDINGLNGLELCFPPKRYILEKNQHKILQSHDLIVEISGGSPTQSTGRLGFVTEATLERFNQPLICSNFCKAITLKDKTLLFIFRNHWDSLYENGIFFNYEGKTSGIKNLLFDSFMRSHKAVIPNALVAKSYYDYALSIHKRVQINLKENQELVTIRDWLLPMLMNGQVSVS